MESAFGLDLAGVRVHADERAAASAQGLGARAYTVGQHIVFGEGRYAPETADGERLLAHELAHVVQQSRGGASAPTQDANGPLEQAATRAASQAVSGSQPVAVAGASAPGVMRQPEEEEAEASRRAREKQRTQERKRERARAGKEESQFSQAEAERELRALEHAYRQPGAKQRALKTKEQDLKRYRALLKRAGGTQLDKNKRQGAFDELQRTPTTTTGAPQTKHVAGGPQLPGQELRAGKDPYAQPDYSVVTRRRDGRFERVHVNLKSDQIDMSTPAKARATARAYVAQAIRNTRHLAQGDKIIISFAQRPTKEIQEEMKREFFNAGSPVAEVRFGTATHKREHYKPPAAQPATAEQKRKTGKKTAKATTAKVAKPPTPLTKTKPKVRTPSVKSPAGTGSKTSTLGVTTPTKLKAAPMKTRASTITTPQVLPKVPTPRITTPKVTTVKPPGISLRGGLSRGGGLRGERGAAGAAIVSAIAIPIINHYLRKHFAEKWEAEQRQLISSAIEARRQDYDKLIEARRAEIQAVQAQGRDVTLRVAVDTNWQDTDLGPALTKAEVGGFQLVFEGDSPRPYKRSLPGGRIGRLVRGYTGTELTYQNVDIVLEGTDPEAKARRQSRKMIEERLQPTMKVPFGGAVPLGPPLSFEQLIVAALENNDSLEPLRDYAVFQTERAVASGAPLKATEFRYWVDMVALLDGTLDELIAAAKAKKIPLTTLRVVAAQRRDRAGQASDAGAGAAAATYWSEVVRLIDAK
jgi:hypothetical protein